MPRAARKWEKTGGVSSRPTAAPRAACSNGWKPPSPVLGLGDHHEAQRPSARPGSLRRVASPQAGPLLRLWSDLTAPERAVDGLDVGLGERAGGRLEAQRVHEEGVARGLQVAARLEHLL